MMLSPTQSTKGITSVDKPGPSAWRGYEEHAASHKYFARLRAAFNGSGPEEYVEIVLKAIKCLGIDAIKKKNAAQALADRQIADNGDFDGPAAATDPVAAATATLAAPHPVPST
jgi:hypothetical protein